nr:MAG TPA: hypothetical protein [Caudoviricetes sp.]
MAPFLFVREDVKTQAAEKPKIPNIRQRSL